MSSTPIAAVEDLETACPLAVNHELGMTIAELYLGRRSDRSSG
jgi:hypothetical protein